MARHAAISQLAAAMCRGDRVALSRALTLVESKNRQKQKEASQLLSAVLPQRRAQSLRIGISGPPGTGKSTLIEALGGELVSRGHRLAVLAVDPSSQRSGGSLMGDKTRMPTLAVNQRAFIRPSPAQGVLGGVARRTSDAILCCECAGYDRIIVETVGVGQSETAVSGLVDMFVLLVPPAAGDGLQGVKRGIMELADLVVVTKADGALEEVASTTAQDMRAALRVLRPRSEVWEHASVEVLERLAGMPEVQDLVERLGARAAAGEISVGQAGSATADHLLKLAVPPPASGMSEPSCNFRVL